MSPRWSKRCVFTTTSMFIPIAPFHHGGGGGGGVIGKRGDLLFFLGDDDDGEDGSRIGEGKEEEKQVVCLNGTRVRERIATCVRWPAEHVGGGGGRESKWGAVLPSVPHVSHAARVIPLIQPPTPT